MKDKHNYQPGRTDLILAVNDKLWIRPQLTFMPNVANQVHLVFSLAFFHIRRWRGHDGAMTNHKAPKPAAALWHWGDF